MKNKIKTFLWFLKRPVLYPELFRRIKSKILCQNTDDNREESELWCQQRAIDTDEAIRQITGSNRTIPFKEKFKHKIAEAQKILHSCPVKMGGEGNLELIYAIAEFLKAQRVIETGVAYGWSSLAILLSLKDREGSVLVSTDMPYPNRNNDKYVGCIVPADLRKNWLIFRRADREALPKAIKKLKTIDMFNYDSDKSYKGRMWVCSKLWQSLRKGGWCIIDDIGDNTAFRDFAQDVNREPIVVRSPQGIPKKFTGLLVK